MGIRHTTWLACALAVGVAVTVDGASSVRAAALPPSTATGWRVVISNSLSSSNSVSITTTGSTRTSNLTTLAAGYLPLGSAITPDGSLALVSNVGSGTVTPIDLASNPPKALATLQTGHPGGSFIAMAPDGRTAYVNDAATRTLVPIDLTRHLPRILPSIRTGTPPSDVAISPDGSAAWVVDSGAGTIHSVDLRTGAHALGSPIYVGPTPEYLVLSPDGSTAYVENTSPHAGIAAVSLDGTGRSTLSVNTALLALTPDGSMLYVPDLVHGTVIPIQVSGTSMRMGKPVAVPHGPNDAQSFPYDVAVSPDGVQLWVCDGGTLDLPVLANHSGVGTTVSVYDIHSNPMTPVLLRTITVGNDPRFIAITPPIITASDGPSTLATALPTPVQAFGSVTAVVVGAGISLAAILFITFPSQLFNLTFQENYATIRDWWRRRLPLGRRSGVATATGASILRRRVAFLATLFGGALLGGLLDPHFGSSIATLYSYAAVVLAICAGIAIPAIVTAIYHRGTHHDARWVLHALPAGLAVAAACVLISRVTQFAPGYLYGVICGVAFGVKPAPREKGHIVALSTLTTLTVSVLFWLLWVPVNVAATRFHPFFGIVILDDFLAAVFVAGMVGSMITLMPLRFLPGWDLREWNQGAWLGCFGLAAFGVVEVLLIPHNDNHSNAPLITTLVLLVVFGGLSVGLREWFARRRRGPGSGQQVSLREHMRDLLTPVDAAVPSPPAE